jgi:hypothetical protein
MLRAVSLFDHAPGWIPVFRCLECFGVTDRTRLTTGAGKRPCSIGRERVLESLRLER